MSQMNPVVHFEMPAGDRDRLTAFYRAAFGWKSQMLGPEMGDYVLVTTAEIGREAGGSGRRHQRRLLPEKTRLAGAISVDRHRGG